MSFHEIFHVVLMVLFLAAVATGFLGLIRPLIEDGADLKLPGPKLTVALFAAALLAGAADWILHSSGR